MTDVVNVVFEHSDTLNAHTEGKSTVNLGVYAAIAEHVGVNHTCAEDLDPALALAKTAALTSAHKAGDVDLSRGLREWEVVRTEADSCVLAEFLSCKGLKHTLKVAHSNALVNNKSLYLMEKGRVSSVNSVRTVNASGRDDSYRRLLLLHGSYLYR